MTAPLDLAAIEADIRQAQSVGADPTGQRFELILALIERCRAAEAERDARRDRKVLNLQLEARVAALESGLRALLDAIGPNLDLGHVGEAKRAARALLSEGTP